MRAVLPAAAICAALAAPVAAQLTGRAQELNRKYLALTESWTRGVRFTEAERQAMERGRESEKLMWDGLDDPLARRARAGGEPSLEALAALYPGKILDRTLLGTWSDPSQDPSRLDNEFYYWWNGAISANLNGQAAHNTNIVFRVGADAEMFGLRADDYSRIGYEDGYLPILGARYRRGGVLYEQTALADKTPGGDIAWVQFVLTNTSDGPVKASLHADVILTDDTPVRYSNTSVLDASGAILVAHDGVSAQFDERLRRVTFTADLAPGAQTSVCLKIPYYPDKPGALGPPRRGEFQATRARVRRFWLELLDRGARIEVPEERVNQIWKALLLQNFILADGRRFTYGSGLRYNDSYYPVENGFGAHTFALYGHIDYAGALLAYSVPVSVDRGQAGRKYQNRRGIPFHHILEHYRLSGQTAVFERYRADLDRAAGEILTERRGTMKSGDGEKPLHWGWLPPDKPAVDLRASTQTVYVPAHNITSCQGLADFGEFLVRTGIDPERGRRYLAEAAGYREIILRAMERSAIRVPGRPPFVDLQTLYFKETADYGPDPYDHLGTGRLQGVYFHYWADMQYRYNFFNPTDQVGRWIADYVASRGGFVLGCTRARVRPEQPYGWINNVYNGGYYDYRLRAGDRDEFLLGFYARLAFGMTRHTYVASEGSPFIGYNTHNGGWVSPDYSFPNSAANAETLGMLRSMLILEELRDNRETGDIHLLAGVPRAWLQEGKRIRVANAPSYFGPISFQVESARGTITARIQPPTRDRWRRLLLHLPHPGRRAIRQVTVNGSPHTDFDSERGLIRLAGGPAEFLVTVGY